MADGWVGGSSESSGGSPPPQLSEEAEEEEEEGERAASPTRASGPLALTSTQILLVEQAKS